MPMGGRFNRKIFLIILPISASIAVTICIALVPRNLAGNDLVIQVVARAGGGLVIGTVLAALLASYRYLTELATKIYRSIVRPLAKHAVRSSLKQAMTPMNCTGILDRNGTVHLNVALGDSDVIGEDDLLYVYEEADDKLWGVVRVVEHIPDSHLICTPTNRVNPQFWGHLEDRVGFDTSAPENIYLIRAMPLDYQRVVENFLDDWR